jgi:hypothetical protein
MNNQNQQNLIEAYFENYRRLIEGKSQDDTIWILDLVDKLIHDEPDKALEFIVNLIDMSKDTAMLAFVAAGPLEELLVYNGTAVIEKLKIVADTSDNIQLALSGVWLDEEEDEIYSAWYDLMKRYGFTGENPRQTL